MAYCKTPGACGRSQVLFAAIDPSIPNYKKICPFKQALKEKKEPGTPIDMYQLHGIIREEEICTLCEKRFDKHKHIPCDQNGWAEVGRTHLSLPSKWPRYDPKKYQDK